MTEHQKAASIGIGPTGWFRLLGAAFWEGF